MASILIDPQPPPNPQKLHNLIGENYELSLNQSMQDLLDSHNSRDLLAIASTFYELMQAKANPPLETIWFYSALTFRHANSTKIVPSDRVSAIKDLFQLTLACSASCSSSKSIVLLAPVIYEVYRVTVDLKREKKVMREVRALVNAILGHISVCCSANDGCGGLGSDSDDFTRKLEDLIRVWIGDGVYETSEEGCKLFFPLLGDDIVGKVSAVSELAGVVITEAFLLKLCLDFGSGVCKQELQKELRTWAVGSITGFHHFCFFETLVRMLLERTLPVNSLLSSEDEVILRNVLSDAVILVDYSFLNPDKLIHLPTKRLNSLAIARVLLTHEATEFFRVRGDQTKALSYANAFSGSQLPCQLIKLVTNEIGMHGKAGQPRGLSPKALLKWVVNLEDRGIKLSDDVIAKYKSRLAFDISEAEHEQLADNKEMTKLDGNLHFYIDNKGEGEGEREGGSDEKDERTIESMNAAFVAAAHTMSSAQNGGERRKRKEGRTIGEKKQVKFLKYKLYDNSGSSGEKPTFLKKDGSSSGSEVENPLSDEDTDEEKEK